MNIKSFVKTQTFSKLPPGIKHHDVWNAISRIEKPFKSIGLLNTLSNEPLRDSPYTNYQHYRIGFSASGAQGVWDIATMSMRGVMSCMHWQNNHSRHLIGSVIDPFLGIIYLTDGSTTSYGVSFKKRCLVRFIYRPTTRTFALMLERSYFDTGNLNPFNYANVDPDASRTYHVFRQFLLNQTQNKYEVVSYQDKEYYDGIPYSSGLNHIGGADRSMSDCSLIYRPVDITSMKSPSDFSLISNCINQD